MTSTKLSSRQVQVPQVNMVLTKGVQVTLKLYNELEIEVLIKKKKIRNIKSEVSFQNKGKLINTNEMNYTDII